MPEVKLKFRRLMIRLAVWLLRRYTMDNKLSHYDIYQR
jgi:hypothetical protein